MKLIQRYLPVSYPPEAVVTKEPRLRGARLSNKVHSGPLEGGL